MINRMSIGFATRMSVAPLGNQAQVIQDPERQAFEIFKTYQGYLWSNDAAFITVALKQFLKLHDQSPTTVGYRLFRAEVTKFVVASTKEYLAFGGVPVESVLKPYSLVGRIVFEDLKNLVSGDSLKGVIEQLQKAGSDEEAAGIKRSFDAHLIQFLAPALIFQTSREFSHETSPVFQALADIPPGLVRDFFEGSESVGYQIFQKRLAEIGVNDPLNRARLFAHFLFAVAYSPSTFSREGFILEARAGYMEAIRQLSANGSGDVAVKNAKLNALLLEYGKYCLKVGAFEDLPSILISVKQNGSAADQTQLQQMIGSLVHYQSINADPVANILPSFVFLLGAKILNRDMDAIKPFEKILVAVRPALLEVFVKDAGQISHVLQRLGPFFRAIEDKTVSEKAANFFDAIVVEAKGKNPSQAAEYERMLKMMAGEGENPRDGR